jgi:hypothetical protein
VAAWRAVVGIRDVAVGSVGEGLERDVLPGAVEHLAGAARIQRVVVRALDPEDHARAGDEKPKARDCAQRSRARSSPPRRPRAGLRPGLL